MSTTATGAEIPARSAALCAPEWVRFVRGLHWKLVMVNGGQRCQWTTTETWIFGRNDIECDYCAYCGGVARILGTVRSVSGPLRLVGVSASQCVTENAGLGPAFVDNTLADGL